MLTTTLAVVVVAFAAVCAGAPSSSLSHAGNLRAAAVPTIPLFNSAVEGLTMPAVGLGTGGYNSNPKVGYNGYPECWSQPGGCADFVTRAVKSWIDVGGRRLDCANSYQNQATVGAAIKETAVDRKDLFILSKVGPSHPLGFQDTLDQFEDIKKDMQIDHVDMLLIHWPFQNPSQGNVTKNNTESKDPFCNHSSPEFDNTKCRISTWKAMVQIFNQGGAKAIGVSNYNASCLQEIVDAGLPLPSLTQNPFHIYRSTTQKETIDFCKAHNITFLGYSPLGVPDWHKFPGPRMSPTPLQDPVVQEIASAHKVTPAQVLLQWQWALGIPVNPRSMSQTHMIENLEAYGFTLADDEVQQLSSRPQDYCTDDPKFYECAKQ